ncbi:MAG: oligosaccharide flippase family protein [archaeon]|nr:oligosaccharide flippase family protein [archaeon]
MPSAYTRGFVRNSFFSYMAKFATLAFGFLYVYVVANFLGPENYGVLSFAMDFLGNLAILLGLTVLPETLSVFAAKGHSRELSTKLMQLTAILGFAFALAVIAFPSAVVSMMNLGTPELIQLVAVVVALNLVSTGFTSFLIGEQKFGKVFKLGLLENAVNFTID